MGLVSRVVPAGTARKAAEQLAREIAGLPQACLRSDRASALDGVSLSHDDAMASEFALRAGHAGRPGRDRGRVPVPRRRGPGRQPGLTWRDSPPSTEDQVQPSHS